MAKKAETTVVPDAPEVDAPAPTNPVRDVEAPQKYAAPLTDNPLFCETIKGVVQGVMMGHMTGKNTEVELEMFAAGSKAANGKLIRNIAASAVTIAKAVVAEAEKAG